MVEKKEILDNFKQQLKLLVDILKGNFEITNDGNISRQFLEECEIPAIITGVNKNLIHWLKVILDILCCIYKII